MQKDVRNIPPAPRRVRLRALLAHRWPLLAIGGGLAVIGGLIAWLMFLQSGGKFSFGPRLDAGPTAAVSGRIRAVLDPVEFDGRRWEEVRFDFHWHDVLMYGGCFLPAGAYQVEAPVQVEVLVEDPNISRIAGGVLHIDRRWLRAQFWIVAMAVPGALLLLGWLAGVFQLRHVLVHGDVSVGSVTGIAPVPLVLPEMLVVRYEFRDHRAAVRRSRHWVRMHGPLGQRLARQQRGGRGEAMPVLHDRRLPQWSRLVVPEDFLPQASSQPEPVNGIR